MTKESKTDVYSEKVKRADDPNIRISIVTTGRCWGKFSRITLCDTGLRFARDVRQNFFNMDESSLY